MIFTDIVDTTAEDVSDHDSEYFSEDEYDGSSLADQFYDEEGNLREDLTEEEMAALLTATLKQDATAYSENVIRSIFLRKNAFFTQIPKN